MTLEDFAEKVENHAVVALVRQAVIDIRAHRNPGHHVWKQAMPTLPDAEDAAGAGDSAAAAEEDAMAAGTPSASSGQQPPNRFFVNARGGDGELTIIVIVFERYSTQFASAKSAGEAKLASEVLGWTIVRNMSFFDDLRGATGGDAAPAQQLTAVERIRNALSGAPKQHILGDAMLRRSLVSLVLAAAPQQHDASELLSTVFYDKDELAAEIEFAARSPTTAAGSDPDALLAELQALVDRPVHGFDKQPGLTKEIVSQLLGAGAPAKAAWASVDNHAECLQAYCASLSSTQHNTKVKVASVIRTIDDLNKAGALPSQPMLKSITDMCTTGAATIIAKQAVVYREVLPAKNAALGTAMEQREKEEKLARSTTLYQFLGLPNDETAGPDQLAIHLTKGLTKTAPYAMNSVGGSSTAKKLVLRMVTAATRLLSPPYRDAFLIYEEMHRAACGEGDTFVFSFAENVTARSLIVDAAMYRIRKLGLHRNELDIVFKKAEGCHVYEFVGKVEDVLDYLFQAEPNGADAYRHARAWVANNRSREPTASPVQSLLSVWPCTKLQRHWYSCQDGLYNVQEDTFYRTGTDEYQEQLEKGVTAFVHFPESKWNEDLATPNFDKVFNAQEYSEKMKTVCLGVCLGRPLYAHGEKDNYQIAGFLKGFAGSGKSVALKTVRHFFPEPLVADLGASTQGNVGQYTNIIGKYLVLIPETSENFGPNGFRDTWCKMVEGEVITVARCGMADWQGKFVGHLLHAGNDWFGWSDYQGAVKRRCVPFPFKRLRPEQTDTTLELEIKKELMMILIKANRAYLKLVEAVGTRSFFHAISTVEAIKCPEIVALSEELSAGKNTIMQFLNDEEWVEVLSNRMIEGQPIFNMAAEGIAFSQFNNAYARWMTLYRPGASKKNITFDLLTSQINNLASQLNNDNIKTESSTNTMSFSHNSSGKQGIRGLRLRPNAAAAAARPVHH